MNNEWNGRACRLDKFTSSHESSFFQFKEAALHVDFQVPTDHSRFGFLLDNVTNNDPDLKAALASMSTNADGMRDDFDTSLAFMLPACPCAKFESTQ